jgi:hypothetical protein
MNFQRSISDRRGIDGGKMPRAVIIGFLALGLISLLVFAGFIFQVPPPGVETKADSGSLAVRYVSTSGRRADAMSLFLHILASTLAALLPEIA